MFTFVDYLLGFMSFLWFPSPINVRVIYICFFFFFLVRSGSRLLPLKISSRRDKELWKLRNLYAHLTMSRDVHGLVDLS
jgi:hypothetical protein